MGVGKETGRVLGPRSGLGEAEVPAAPEDPSRLRSNDGGCWKTARGWSGSAGGKSRVAGPG